jgi:pilus assembly protein CpaD
MSRIKTFASIALLAGMASACAAPAANELSAANNPSIYSVHQPVVQRTDFVLDVQADARGLSAAEADRLRGWFDSIGLRYGDTVAIDGDGNDSAARADIARVVDEYGLLMSHAAPVTGSRVPAGSVRIVASRSSATVPDCPNWDPSDNGVAPPQNTSSNFGCATAGNLAAMVANPNDLVEGQNHSGRGSASTAGRAIRTYREVPPTGRQGLPATTTTQGSN